MRISVTLLNLMMAALLANACAAPHPTAPKRKSADSIPKPNPSPTPSPTPTPAPSPSPAPAPAPAPVIPVIPVVPPVVATVEYQSLLGTWTQCEVDKEEIVPLSILYTYAFKDEKLAVLTVSYFSDKECKKAWTQADGDAALKAWEKEFPGEDFSDYKAYYASINKSESKDTGYVAGKIKAGETGDFDMTVGAKTYFLAYKIDGNKLFISESCEDETAEAPSDGESETLPVCVNDGLTAAKRSKDFSRVIPFLKMP